MKNFYETVLPARGVHCVAAIDKKGVVKHYWLQSTKEVEEKVEEIGNQGRNVYFALGSFFDDSKRSAANCHSMRSFFVDLDCKGGDTYESKEAAIASLISFCKKTKFPRPMVVDSGNGVHAYWPFDKEIETKDWAQAANKLKMLCSYHKFMIDRSVTGDAARILRAPGTLNYNSDEPKPAELLTEAVSYDFGRLSEIIDTQCESAGIGISVDPILAKAHKGLDENSRAFLNASNFESKFSKIVIKSIKDEGCAQIKKAVESPTTCDYPLWRACLSVAVRCSDGATAIHKISEGHPEYSYEETERKASDTAGPYRCESFEESSPGGCDGCQHRGQITSPIQLGRTFKKPEPVVEVEVEEGEEKPTSRFTEFPPDLFPFIRGAKGGIYWMPPAEFDKKTKKKVEQDPILIYEHDIEIVDRSVSPRDGECLLVRIHLPKDAVNEFYIPLKNVVSITEIREIYAKNGVAALPKQMEKLMEYTTRWANFLQKQKTATRMRDQLGWTDNMESFIWGEEEIFLDGSVKRCPASPTSRMLAVYQKAQGEFDVWKESFNRFNLPGFEIHAFAALSGFGSVLMPFTGLNGIAINMFGKAGSGKTSAVRAALSIWGSDRMMLADTTLIAARQRAAVLKNIPLGIDEATNKKSQELSEFIYHYSSGKTKGRMQSSLNIEREHLEDWSSMALLTGNASIYDKLTQYKSQTDGETARLMEFQVIKPSILTNDAVGAEFFKPLTENYGHAGPVFIRWVLAHKTETEELIKHYIARFRKDFRSESKDRFWSSGVGVTMAGAHIAKDLGLHDIDIERVYAKLLEELGKTSKTSSEIMGTAFDVLNEFLMKHTNNTLVINSERGKYSLPVKTPTSYEGLTVRYEPDTNSTYIMQKVLSSYLTDIQFSRRAFEEELTEKGILVKTRFSKRMAGGWEGAVESSVQQTYKFVLPKKEDE